MLLLGAERLAERRSVASASLAPLAASLAADLEPLLGRDLHVPAEKALLSRAGGRCADDGESLDFDPFSPHQHRCPRCGRTYEGELHHRWWVYFYQLWLAERAVHGALLFLLRGDDRHARLARDIARRYADAYLAYPNRDNVLGPTRLFFSTYLESIWLLQICVAADLLEAAGDGATADDLRSRVVAPSAALIAQYDEGFSNRQAWNNAALMAAALLLGDRASAERVVRAPSGLEAHLAHGLLSDGTWYEGENYHLFAHRGLWYGVTLAETAGIALDSALIARFQEGFAAPFATALPDFTFPARKDSQYAVSLQQWRFAELCELGLARQDDPRLGAALARLYAVGVAAGDTGRARSTADVERNLPPARLTRADLGWRSLLHARAELPPLEGAVPRSALLEGQGIAVFRRERGGVYVALDYGQSGGGHGHPDRLNLLFAQDGTRWLDDLGTGSYVDPSLHWYRSTLAHNAPLVNGRSQLRVDGSLLAYDERESIGWALAAAEIAPGVRVERAVVVTTDYFVEELRWSAPSPVRFELPIHFDGELAGAELSADALLDGGDGFEDGFSFVRGGRAAVVAPMTAITLVSRQAGRAARAWVCVDRESRWFQVLAPGQPAGVERPFFVVRCEEKSGIVRAVWSWSPRVEEVRLSRVGVDVTCAGERHENRRTPDGWRVDSHAHGARTTVDLAGRRAQEAPAAEPSPAPAPAHAPAPAPAHAPAHAPASDEPIEIRRGASAVTFELGEPHYRRSEETWAEAGRPSARVETSARDDELIVRVAARVREPTFVPADAANPYDNEHPDINGHGVQLYVRTPSEGGAWMIVPETGKREARVRPLEGWGALALRRAEWQPTAEGYELRAHVALTALARAGTLPFALDVLVNETAPGRERRRGQLVLSGAAGEFVYLRGDRHDPARLVPFVLVG